MTKSRRQRVRTQLLLGLIGIPSVPREPLRLHRGCLQLVGRRAYPHRRPRHGPELDRDGVITGAQWVVEEVSVGDG